MGMEGNGPTEEYRNKLSAMFYLKPYYWNE